MESRNNNNFNNYKIFDYRIKDQLILNQCMEIDLSTLFIEINDKNYIFVVMKFPEDLKYTNEHEWIRIEKDIVVVGITDFAQSELGDIVYVDLDVLGQVIEINEVFGTIEAVKTVSDLFMPVSGEILEFNLELVQILRILDVARFQVLAI